MKMLYKTSLIVYRLILTLTIPVLLLGNFLTAAAGHNRHFAWTDYALFAYLIVTVAILTLYIKIEKEDNSVTTVLFFAATGLVLTSILFAFYELYDTLFICKCFTNGDTLTSLLVFSFTVISAIVLTGLIEERKALLQHRLDTSQTTTL